MNRLLIVGAGATIEESAQSGRHPDDPAWSFPVVSNFCSRLFDPTSQTLLRSTASYLDSVGIPYDSTLLNLREGSFSAADIERGPVRVFTRLEAENAERHNIERLCEHVWNTHPADDESWSAFIHAGIFLNLFAVFTEQFGLGVGRPMHAGRRVASLLTEQDLVVNLNYDIAFDLAMKQAGRTICYGPVLRAGAIPVLKPHGSFNLYINRSNGNCFFEEPDLIPGSVGLPDPHGGMFFSHDGIVPPRLNKSYQQHPASAAILESGRPFQPTRLTFWGIGLTDSDIDLLTVYREACDSADAVEFVNPSVSACATAARLLGRTVTHYPTLDKWLSDAETERVPE